MRLVTVYIKNSKIMLHLLLENLLQMFPQMLLVCLKKSALRLRAAKINQLDNFAFKHVL